MTSLAEKTLECPSLSSSDLPTLASWLGLIHFHVLIFETVVAKKCGHVIGGYPYTR